MIICSCLVTVEYCLDTTHQLQDKMKTKVDQDMVDKINFSSELELLQSVTTNCVGLLVRELEAACDAALGYSIKLSFT